MGQFWQRSECLRRVRIVGVELDYLGLSKGVNILFSKQNLPAAPPPQPSVDDRDPMLRIVRDHCDHQVANAAAS